MAVALTIEITYKSKSDYGVRVFHSLMEDKRKYFDNSVDAQDYVIDALISSDIFTSKGL